jgi:hypothetical protein
LQGHFVPESRNDLKPLSILRACDP